MASTFRPICLVVNINFKMSDRIQWFDRKFNFENLTGTIDSILERLKGTPIRLQSKISQISSDLYIVNSGEAWSIQENVGHLLDLEPLWLGRVEDMVDGEKTLRPTDLKNTKTFEALHNQKPMGELLANFQQERTKLVVRVEQLSDRAEELQGNHPRLGTPMRLIDLAYFVAEHDDHHLARISQISKFFIQNQQSQQ